MAFVSKGREPAGGRPNGFFPGAPDLAVEIISPSETAAEVLGQVSQYFDAGTRQVWIVYPDLRQVLVFRSARQGVVLLAEDTLDGGDLLPGFACRVSELFE